MKTRKLFNSIPSNQSFLRISVYPKFLANYLDRLWHILVSSAAIHQEPKVTLRRDRQGRSYYEIYDSCREKYYRFGSEQEVRIWLERDRFQ